MSIHLCGLLLFLIFSLGLVMYLLPPTNIGNEEMAVVKAIPSSPGSFLNSDIWPIYTVWLVKYGLLGNLRKPTAAVSGRFPDFFINKKMKTKIYTNRKFRNLPDTAAAGF